VNIAESGGAATTTWVGSTVFSTMGTLVDANGNIQQLLSVNALGGNSTQYGTSGSGQPGWNQTPGNTTASDGSITWVNKGPIVAWSASKLFNNATTGGTLANPCIVYDTKSKSCYIVADAGGASGTSGSVYPGFTGGFGNIVFDGSVKWFCLGSLKIPPSWQPLHNYPQLGTVSNDDSISGISEPNQWWRNLGQRRFDTSMVYSHRDADVRQSTYLAEHGQRDPSNKPQLCCMDGERHRIFRDQGFEQQYPSLPRGWHKQRNGHGFHPLVNRLWSDHD
jgi:hypothetical protein